jgi:small subunit ribosomal protein S36
MTSPDASPPGSVASRIRRWVSSVPRLVWWVTGVHIALLAAYSILLPTYRAPDEQLHVDLAHVFAETLHYPAWDERDTGTGIEHSLDIVHYDDRSANLTAEAAPPKSERPSIDDLEDPSLATAANQLPQHPPLYYAMIGGAERLVDEVVPGDPIGSFDVETWFYRMISVALVAPLPLIIWRTAQALGVPSSMGIAACIVPLTIPQLTHIGSAVNNDSLMMLAFWLLTPVVLRMSRGDLGPRVAVLAGVVTGVGLFTKGFSLILPFWVVAALVTALWRRLADLRTTVRAGLIYMGVSLICGGWWWIRNLIAYGELSPSRYSELVPDAVETPSEFGRWIQSWSYYTTRRFWGDFGWFDTHIDGPAVALASLVFIVGLVVCCCRRDRVANSPLADRLTLAAPFLLLVVLQFGLALVGYINTGQMPGLQGRYWFGAVAGLAVVVALGLANLVRDHLNRLPLAMLIGAGIMQLLGVRAIVGFYWGAPGSGVADRIRAMVAWAPIPGELIGLGAVVGAVVVIGTLVQVGSLAFRPPGAQAVPIVPHATTTP